jgi:hypothetical protein
MFRCPLSMSFLNSSTCFCNVMMVLVSSSDMLFGVEAILCVNRLVTLDFSQLLKDAQERVHVDKSSIFLVAKSRYQSELRRLWLISSPSYATLTSHILPYTTFTTFKAQSVLLINSVINYQILYLFAIYNVVAIPFSGATPVVRYLTSYTPRMRVNFPTRPIRPHPCSYLSHTQKMSKTYNSGYSPVVTHLTTNPPVHCLSTAERTGSSIFSVLWSYVTVFLTRGLINISKSLDQLVSHLRLPSHELEDGFRPLPT